MGRPQLNQNLRVSKHIGGLLVAMKNNDFVAPHIVKEAFIFIERDCHIERLFEADLRPPYSDQVQEFRVQIANVRKGSLSTLFPNTHVACGMLKRYFDELSEPLLSFKSFEYILDKSNNPIEIYTMFVERLQKQPKQNQNLFAYITNFCYRLQRKQAAFTPELLAKALAPHILRDETPGKFNLKAVNLLTVVLKQYHEHFPKGTHPPVPPPTKLVDLEDDNADGGFIAVRVNNYQVTSLLKGVRVKSVRALYRFDARKPEEISMQPGDIIEVTYQDDEPGWWEGRLRGCTGIFPANYCEVYELLKRKRRKMKIDTTKVSDKILLMQHALALSNSSVAEPTPDNEEGEIVPEDEKKDLPKLKGIEQPEELPSLKKFKFTGLKIYEALVNNNLKNMVESLCTYHEVLCFSQQKVFGDLEKGESNKPLVFHIDDDGSENSENSPTRSVNFGGDAKSDKKEKEKEKPVEENVKKQGVSFGEPKTLKSVSAQNKDAKQPEKKAGVSFGEVKIEKKAEAPKKAGAPKENVKEKSKSKKETDRKSKHDDKDKKTETKKTKSKTKRKARKDKASGKEKTGRKSRKDKSKKEPAKQDGKQKEGDKPEEQPTATPDVATKDATKPEPQILNEAPSVSESDATESGTKDTNPSVEEPAKPIVEQQEAPVEPIEPKKSPTVEQIKETFGHKNVPSAKEPTVTTKEQKDKKPLVKLEKRTEKSQTTTPETVIATPEISDSMNEAFKADQSLFEQFQQLQKQIEEERGRSAAIEQSVQSTTNQLSSVISKFEIRYKSQQVLVQSLSVH